MRALVTGAAGFVGSTLARRLLADGHDVVGVDSVNDYYDRQLKRANLGRLASTGFQFVEADLNAVDLRSLLAGTEVVFHDAGQPGVRSSWGSEFDRYVTDNVRATQRLLEAALHADRLRRFVFASSSSVYGDAERYPTEETDRPQPLSPYGVTKLAAEHLCTLYARNHGLPTVSLRFFTVYGPRQRPDMAFTRFCRAVSDGRQIEVYGTGEQVRDFTYVDDVVEANLQVGTADIGRPGRERLQRGRRRVDHGERGARAARGDLRPRGARRPRCAGPRRRAAHGWKYGGAQQGDRLDAAGRPREGLEEQYRWAAGV